MWEPLASFYSEARPLRKGNLLSLNSLHSNTDGHLCLVVSTFLVISLHAFDSRIFCWEILLLILVQFGWYPDALYFTALHELCHKILVRIGWKYKFYFIPTHATTRTLHSTVEKVIKVKWFQLPLPTAARTQAQSGLFIEGEAWPAGAYANGPKGRS